MDTLPAMGFVQESHELTPLARRLSATALYTHTQSTLAEAGIWTDTLCWCWGYMRLGPESMGCGSDVLRVMVARSKRVVVMQSYREHRLRGLFSARVSVHGRWEVPERLKTPMDIERKGDTRAVRVADFG